MAKIADFWTHIFQPPPMKNFCLDSIFFLFARKFLTECHYCCWICSIISVSFTSVRGCVHFMAFLILKVHTIRDVFMNKHNIIDSFFNDMFRPSSVGKAKSPIVKSCRCPFLGSKSETVIRMYTDKMSCVFRFYYLVHQILKKWGDIKHWNLAIGFGIR